VPPVGNRNNSSAICSDDIAYIKKIGTLFRWHTLASLTKFLLNEQNKIFLCPGLRPSTIEGIDRSFF
jgi:hypothetical protein